MKKILEGMWERKNSEKGFTLVELIAVLVIMAILASVMIPPMVGWIGMAREKEVLVEGRTLYLAAQTLASEVYSETGDIDLDGNNIIALTGMDIDEDDITFKVEDGVITEFTYKKSIYTAVYRDGVWEVISQPDESAL